MTRCFYPKRVRKVCRNTSMGLAALGLIAAASSAMADGLVFSGAVDAGVAYTSNVKGKSLVSTVSGLQTSSYFSLSGSEDLGDGNHAIFGVYAPFSVQSGAINPVVDNGFFNTTVLGMSSDTYGTVTVGRLWAPTSIMLRPYTASHLLGYFASHVGDADNLHATEHANNAIKYMSPVWAGWSFGALYSLPAGSNRREIDVASSYTGSNFNVAAGYFAWDRSEASAQDDALTLAYAQYGLTRFDVSPNLKSLALRESAYMAGGSIDLGRWTLGGVYSSLQYGYASGVGLGLYNAEINAAYQLTPADRLIVAYVRTQVRSGPMGYRPVWTQLNAGAQHTLSNRTMLYVSASYQQVSGSGVPDAQIFGAAKSSNRFQVVTVVGIRHRF